MTEPEKPGPPGGRAGMPGAFHVSEYEGQHPPDVMSDGPLEDHPSSIAVDAAHIMSREMVQHGQPGQGPHTGMPSSSVEAMQHAGVQRSIAFGVTSHLHHQQQQLQQQHHQQLQQQYHEQQHQQNQQHQQQQ
eukprot:Selendium_serpulae@DN11631_c0_g1_i1.p2